MITKNHNADNYYWEVCQMVDGVETPLLIVDELTFRIIPAVKGMIDADAFIAATELVSELREKTSVWIEKAKNSHTYTMNLKTKNGTLTAEAEPSEIVGSDYDAIYTGIIINNDPMASIDLAAVHSKDDCLKLYAWDNVYDESYTKEAQIDKADIDELAKMFQ